MRSRSSLRLLPLLAAVPLVRVGVPRHVRRHTAPPVARPERRGLGRLVHGPLRDAVSGAEISGTVTFWNGYAADGDEITTFTEVVLPAFNALYPNVTVEHQEIPYDDLRQKLVTGPRRRHPAGRPPGGHHLGARSSPTRARCSPLDEEMPDFDELIAGSVPRARSRPTSGSDHYYGLPARHEHAGPVLQHRPCSSRPASPPRPTTHRRVRGGDGAGQGQARRRDLRLRRGRHRPVERAAVDLELRRRHHRRRAHHRDRARSTARARWPR